MIVFEVLTKRTFFRYFADKREVLFSGAAILEKTFVGGIRGAAADAPPLDAIAAGLDAAAEIFEQVGDRVRKRQAILVANPELQERELIKLARLAAAGAEALRDRGVAEPAAGLAAEAAMAVLRVSFDRWTADPDGQDLRALLRQSLSELRSMAGAI